MLAVHLMSVLLLAASSLAWAQLVIENPGHLDMPEQQAQVLFLTTNRVLESEFHSPGALENAFRMKLVLGGKAERFTIDDSSGNGTSIWKSGTKENLRLPPCDLLFSIYWVPTGRSACSRKLSGVPMKLRP